VCFTQRDLPSPATPPPFGDIVPDDVTGFLDGMGIPDGTPFLLSPRFEYDVALNSYFLQPSMAMEPRSTAENRARALERLLTFLWASRGARRGGTPTRLITWRFTDGAGRTLPAREWRERRGARR